MKQTSPSEQKAKDDIIKAILIPLSIVFALMVGYMYGAIHTYERLGYDTSFKKERELSGKKF